MKRLGMSFLSLLLLVGCSMEEPEINTNKIVNPIVEYDTLKEAEDVVGVTVKFNEEAVELGTPSAISESIVQVSFTYNEKNYNFRASKKYEGEALYGVYGDYTATTNTTYTVLTFTADECTVITYSKGDVHYSIYTNSILTDEEINDLTTIVLEI